MQPAKQQERDMFLQVGAVLAQLEAESSPEYKAKKQRAEQELQEIITKCSLTPEEVDQITKVFNELLAQKVLKFRAEKGI